MLDLSNQRIIINYSKEKEENINKKISEILLKRNYKDKVDKTKKTIQEVLK